MEKKLCIVVCIVSLLVALVLAIFIVCEGFAQPIPLLSPPLDGYEWRMARVVVVGTDSVMYLPYQAETWWHANKDWIVIVGPSIAGLLSAFGGLKWRQWRRDETQ